MNKKILVEKIISFALVLTMLVTYTGFGQASIYAGKINMAYLYFGNTESQISYVNNTKESLQIVSPSYFDLNTDGSLSLTDKLDKFFIKKMHEKGIKVVPFLSNHWDRNVGRMALSNREKLAKEIVDAIEYYELDGVNIDIENLTEMDRDNYTDFMKILDDNLSSGKQLSIAVAANPKNIKTGWQGSYDYSKLGDYSDYVIIMAYDESYFGSLPGPVASFPFVEASIKSALKSIPKEKILLGMPLYGRYWNINKTKGGYGISLKDVKALKNTYNGITYFDGDKRSPVLKFDIEPKDKEYSVYGRRLKSGSYEVWYENEISIKSKLELVQKYKLAGTAAWSLGQETDDVWDYYNLWVNGYYFKDILGHWAEDDILAVNQKGLMNGIANDVFDPNSNLTRAQAVVAMVRVLKLEKTNDERINFTDINDTYWAREEIKIGMKYGLIRGVGDNQFSPDSPITREQMAVLFYRVLNSFSSINIIGEYRYKFKDINSNQWSYYETTWMAKHGIFNGYQDNTFRPLLPITRAQMAVLLNRTWVYLK